MIKFYSNSMIQTDVCSSLLHFHAESNQQLRFVVLYLVYLPNL